MLATLLALHGGEDDWLKIAELARNPRRQASADELRLQASLLVGRGGKENLLKARRILENLITDPRKSIPDDNLLLARLLEAEGKTALAHQQYLAVVNRPDAQPHASGAVRQFLVAAQTWARMRPPGSRNCGSNCPTTWASTTCTPDGSTASDRDSEIEPAVEALAKRLLKKPSENDQQRAARESAVVVRGGQYLHGGGAALGRRTMVSPARQAGPATVCAAGRVAGAAESPGRGGGSVHRGGKNRPFRAAGDYFGRRARLRKIRRGRGSVSACRASARAKPWRATPRTRIC